MSAHTEWCPSPIGHVGEDCWEARRTADRWAQRRDAEVLTTQYSRAVLARVAEGMPARSSSRKADIALWLVRYEPGRVAALRKG